MYQCIRIIQMHFRNQVQISHISFNKTMSTLLAFNLIVLYIDVYFFNLRLNMETSQLAGE